MSESDVMPACCCPHDGNGGGRHGWDPWCVLHGIEARIAAGIWPASMATEPRHAAPPPGKHARAVGSLPPYEGRHRK